MRSGLKRDTRNSLVVYYSHSGHTKKIAREISRNLNCDIEEIKTSASYDGFWGYQRALIHAIFKIEPKIAKLKHDLADYDLVIIGGPVWGGSLSAPIRSFLASNQNNLKKVAFFLTQGGEFGRAKAFEQMEKSSGKIPSAKLAVSDQMLKNETFTQWVSEFTLKLQKQNPDIIKKNILQQMRPISTTNLSSSKSI